MHVRTSHFRNHLPHLWDFTLPVPRSLYTDRATDSALAKNAGMGKRRCRDCGRDRAAGAPLAATGSLRISGSAGGGLSCQHLHGDGTHHLPRLVRQPVGAVDAGSFTASVDLVGRPVHEAASIRN